MSISAPVKYALCAAAVAGTAYLAATHYSKAEEAAQQAFQDLQQCFTASGAKECAIGAASHLCNGIETGLRWSWNAITSPQAKWLAGAVVEYTPKAAYALYQGAINAPGAVVAAASTVGNVLDAAGTFAKEAVSLPLSLIGGAASLLPGPIAAGIAESIQNLKGAVDGVNSKLAGALLPAAAYGAAKAGSLFSRLFSRKPLLVPQQADQIVELGLPPEIQAILGGRRVLLHFPADGQGPWGFAQAPQHLLMEAGRNLLEAMIQNPGLYDGAQNILLTIQRPNDPALRFQAQEEAEDAPAPAQAAVFQLPRPQGLPAIAGPGEE